MTAQGRPAKRQPYPSILRSAEQFYNMKFCPAVYSTYMSVMWKLSIQIPAGNYDENVDIKAARHAVLSAFVSEVFVLMTVMHYAADKLNYLTFLIVSLWQEEIFV